jgi:hypothetical protein
MFIFMGFYCYGTCEKVIKSINKKLKNDVYLYSHILLTLIPININNR